MDKDKTQRALKALERQEKQYRRQNEYIKNNYDRLSVTFPKGYKNIMRGIDGESVNGYINRLVREDLTRRGLLRDASESDQQGTTAAGDTPTTETTGGMISDALPYPDIPF